MVKKVLLAVLSVSIGVSSVRVYAKPVDSSDRYVQDVKMHGEAIEQLEMLLTVDRAHFYAQNLADAFEGKVDPEIIKALRSVTPEDLYPSGKGIYLKTINQHKAILDLVSQKLADKGFKITDAALAEKLQWNYEFFKNKMAARFILKEYQEARKAEPINLVEVEAPAQRSVPKISGTKYLLDTERYIAEKTTRAIFWDAIISDRDFYFHVGNQQDFQNTVKANKIRILHEVKPMANNYNKIFFVYDERTNRYAYMMNLISGDDRVKHLIAQLRLIKFEGKTFFDNKKDKVRVFGDVAEFHKRQENALIDIYRRLPKADKVIIGQKGAIEDAIKNAGMLSVLTTDTQSTLNSMALPQNKADKFSKIVTDAKVTSAFQLSAIQKSPVKVDVAYQNAKDTVARNYAQFTSEQASHEFSDYLLLDKDGNVKRWRVISAVWGDEIKPIAIALRKTNHMDIVYIGTAGAIDGKGLKVGDVVAGSYVTTHEGHKLPFSEGKLQPTPSERPYVVGQVHTPFEETDTWLKKQGPGMDIVEVETGYLRQQLDYATKLEAYFLISDVVGSESETLAHAAQSSSKRKNGQLRLLENLFVSNGIVAPISNFEPIQGDAVFRTTLKKAQELRPSRDILSLFQITQVAIRNGKTSVEDLEALLKKEPAFDRWQMDAPLKMLGGLLHTVQNRLTKKSPIGIIANEIFNGTYNPKVKTEVTIVLPEGVSVAAMKQSLGDRWPFFHKALNAYFDLKMVEAKQAPTSQIKYTLAKDYSSFYELYREEVLHKAGFISEVDDAGRNRVKQIPGLAGGVKCEAVFR
ncbi:hypothetical protein [Bdellovibrio sp. HCB209]|uniref:hypothetical protein n=1 Tax=Bdellovibrio sp. HCB209 TaxID=3394354 RepID=UPI0039B6C6C0